MLQVGNIILEVAVKTSSSTEMVTAGGKWGNCRMEDIIMQYQLSILMTLANTAIKISIIMLSRNDCFDWALLTLDPNLGHGLWNFYLGCLSFNQGIFSGPLTITQTSYLMMFSVIIVDYPVSFLALSASKFKALKNFLTTEKCEPYPEYKSPGYTLPHRAQAM